MSRAAVVGDYSHSVVRAYRGFWRRYVKRLFGLLEMVEAHLATLAREQEQDNPDPIKQAYRQYWLECSERLLELQKKIESHLTAMADHKGSDDAK